MPKPNFSTTTVEPTAKMTKTRQTRQSKQTPSAETTTNGQGATKARKPRQSKQAPNAETTMTGQGTTAAEPNISPIASSTRAGRRNTSAHAPNVTVVDSRVVLATTSAAAQSDDVDNSPMSQDTSANASQEPMSQGQPSRASRDPMSRTSDATAKRKSVETCRSTRKKAKLATTSGEEPNKSKRKQSTSHSKGRKSKKHRKDSDSDESDSSISTDGESSSSYDSDSSSDDDSNTARAKVLQALANRTPHLRVRVTLKTAERGNIALHQKPPTSDTRSQQHLAKPTTSRTTDTNVPSLTESRNKMSINTATTPGTIFGSTSIPTRKPSGSSSQASAA